MPLFAGYTKSVTDDDERQKLLVLRMPRPPNVRPAYCETTNHDTEIGGLRFGKNYG